LPAAARPGLLADQIMVTRFVTGARDQLAANGPRYRWLVVRAPVRDRRPRKLPRMSRDGASVPYPPPPHPRNGALVPTRDDPMV
jgi:hypothetical protein